MVREIYLKMQRSDFILAVVLRRRWPSPLPSPLPLPPPPPRPSLPLPCRCLVQFTDTSHFALYILWDGFVISQFIPVCWHVCAWLCFIDYWQSHITDICKTSCLFINWKQTETKFVVYLLTDWNYLQNGNEIETKIIWKQNYGNLWVDLFITGTSWLPWQASSVWSCVTAQWVTLTFDLAFC